MLAKSLALFLLVTISVAEIPSYIKVCGRTNQNLDKCVIESVERLREKLRTGMPELDAPSLEPLKLKGLPLSMTKLLQAHATNVKLYGLSDFEVKSLHINLEEKTIDIEAVFKKVIIDADYDAMVRIVVPISRNGLVHIETGNVHAKLLLKYKLIKKNGVEYMFVPTMTTKLTVTDFTAHLKRVEEGPENPLSIAVNAALEGGRQEILQSIKPGLEKAISEELIMFTNKICRHFTYNELFPDHE